VPDREERALVLIGGGLPNYWGVGDATWTADTAEKGFSWARGGGKRLYPAKVVELMAMCMNSRLHGRVRDQLSLTYYCDFDPRMPEGYGGGHFITKVFAEPSKVEYATQAAVEVLRSPSRLPFMDREVEGCKKVLINRLRYDQRERGFWVKKLRPAPGGQEARTMEEEIEALNSLTTDDVQYAWQALTGLNDPFVVMAVSGGPGAAQMLPGGPVVYRERRPPPAPAAGGGGGVGMDFLD